MSYTPASKASREIENFNKRKNTHLPLTNCLLIEISLKVFTPIYRILDGMAWMSEHLT